jgi:hypothetical protein
MAHSISDSVRSKIAMKTVKVDQGFPFSQGMGPKFTYLDFKHNFFSLTIVLK